jgi:23S rRNA A2030 N6-methylase RlmJ
VLLDHLGSRPYPHYRKTLKELDRLGVQWHLMLPVQPHRGRYQRPDLRNHRKLLVADGEVAFIGSLNLIDPSYELKNDYAKVSACVQDSLKRFATGTYLIWYPVIPRPEAHDLPRRLKTLANQAGKPWLHATLAIGQREEPATPGEPQRRPGLTASGVFLVNPPHTLKAGLTASLPQLAQVLGRGRGKGQTLESGG